MKNDGGVAMDNKNLDALFDENLPCILNDFLGYLYTVKGKSLNTIDGYKVDLRLFLKYIKK